MFRQLCSKRSVSILSRVWSGNQATGALYSEQELTEKLQRRFPNAKQISVVDTSGGCGAMYEISIQSSDFVGVSRVNQHRMITDTLKEQIKNIHGLRIQTTVPDSGNGK